MEISINDDVKDFGACKTLQGGGSRSEAFIYIFIWPFDHVITWGCMENENRYIHFYEA